MHNIDYSRAMLSHQVWLLRHLGVDFARAPNSVHVYPPPPISKHPHALGRVQGKGGSPGYTRVAGVPRHSRAGYTCAVSRPQQPRHLSSKPLSPRAGPGTSLNLMRIGPKPAPCRKSGFRAGFRADGQRAAFEAFPTRIRPRSEPEARFPARRHYCAT